MTRLKLVQISDFHFTKITWNPLKLFSKRLLGNLNWVFARKGSFSNVHLKALPDFLKTLQPDHILLGGDFTTSSLPSEFALAQEFVEKLPAPWIAVPGNHDRYTFSACKNKEFYTHFPNRLEAKYSLKEHRVEAHKLSSDWWLIALDTARATHFHSSSGLFSEASEEILKTLLAEIPSNAKILLFNHYPFFQNDSPRRSLERGKALEAILKKDPRIKAYLHGHTHRHTIADLQPSQFPVILDGGCSGNIEKGSWNLLEIDEDGIAIDVYQWKNGWTVTKREKIIWTR